MLFGRNGNSSLAVSIVIGEIVERSPEEIEWQREYLRARRHLLASGPSCEYCDEPFATTADHILPRSRGGGNEPENLAAACRSCNEEKLDFTPAEWEAWRKAKGYPWPPVSRTAFFMARYEIELARQLEP